MKTLQVLSLGAGVQSSTILLMSFYGLLPPLDSAVFADTGWETFATYSWLKFLQEKVGDQIPIIVVSAGNIRSDIEDSKRWASMPFNTLNLSGKPGKLRRQCTREYKVTPIKKALRNLLGLKRYEHAEIGAVDLWMGISTDESHRQRLSSERWISNYYPLIEKEMSRFDCLKWFASINLPAPPRSSCIGCPYHSNEEWRSIMSDPDAWSEAITFDNKIRSLGSLAGNLYLHQSCIPLDEIDFSTLEDHGQLNFLDCEGICGT